MRVDWCVSSWFRIKNTHSLTHYLRRLLGLKKEKKERKKTDNPREGWEDGTPPPHRDFKERGVMR